MCYLFQSISHETSDKNVKQNRNEQDSTRKLRAEKSSSFTHISSGQTSSSMSFIGQEPSGELVHQKFSEVPSCVVGSPAGQCEPAVRRNAMHNRDSLEARSYNQHLLHDHSNADVILKTSQQRKESDRNHEQMNQNLSTSETLFTSESALKDDDCLEIPDTPEVVCHKELVEKKRLKVKHQISRSFLVSTSSLCSKPISSSSLKTKPNKGKAQRTTGHNVIDSRVSSLGKNIESKVGMISVMSDMGFDMHQRAQMGMDCELAKMKNGCRQDSSPRKRTCSKGSSPSPKRIASKITPVKATKLKHLVSRGAEMVHNSKSIIGQRKCSDDEAWTSTFVATVNDVADIKENLKWGLKRESFSIKNGVCSSLTDAPHKANRDQHSKNDENTLVDILSELKAALLPDGMTSQQEAKQDFDVSSIKGKETNCSPLKKATLNDTSSSTAESIVARAAFVEDEDEALDEILSELKTNISTPVSTKAYSNNLDREQTFPNKGKTSEKIATKKYPLCASRVFHDMNHLDKPSTNTEIKLSTSSMWDMLTTVPLNNKDLDDPTNSESCRGRKSNNCEKLTEEGMKSNSSHKCNIKEDMFPLDSEFDELARSPDKMSPFKVNMDEVLVYHFIINVACQNCWGLC